MNKTLLVAFSLGVAMAVAQPVVAQTPAPEIKLSVPMEALPRYGSLVSAWYKKPVYDTNEKKVGIITDMLFSGGEVNAVMLDVGGFLGIGAKHVAIPANDITVTEKNNKTWLTINTTKDIVKKATGYKYDAKEHAWKKI
ncbi:MAG: PRC-barrel domain-containing protein [Methylocystis sp.]|uniref:PRC-barrel domain-containing protein n=1 Tax=Methylocystis sp. TaxID=1911079 RepID=UPI003924909B